MHKGAVALMLIIILVIVSIFFILTREANKLSPVPEGELPEPGLTPKNPFYFIDRITENFLLFVYLNPESKAEVAFRLSKEKLAEVKFLEQQTVSSLVIEEINKKAAIKANELYEKYLTIARENLIKSDENQNLETDLSFEFLDNLLSQELPPAQSTFNKLFQYLPESIQNKLIDLANWFGKTKEQAGIYYQEQKNKTKIFFRDYLKQKASNFIDSLFKTEE